MIIGILQCDYVRPQYEHLLDVYGDMFVELFERHCPEMQTRIYDVMHGEYPASMDECDGYLITGSKHSVYEDLDWINQLKAYVQELAQAEKKVVGICFGHQLLAAALGGRTVKSKKGWGVGVHPVQVDAKKAWMEPISDRVYLNVSHQDQVVELPENAEVLGGNGHCAVGLFVIGDTCLGIQGHPEIGRPYLEISMASRAEQIGTDRLTKAKVSLSQPTDERIVARWIYNFFAQ